MAALMGDAHANPIVAETGAKLTSTGKTIEAEFLGSPAPDGYANLHVQWQRDAEWVTATTSWTAGATVESNNGSGLADFVVYTTSFGCPEVGSLDVRFAFYDSYHDEYGEWTRDTVVCEEVDESAADGGCQCDAARGGGALAFAGLFGLLLWRRRAAT
ncbi:MAG: hypothetical protein KC486_12705 [Myxococcales bacterium]|nr:hypothetical protein [Myxococcales bacterium]